MGARSEPRERQGDVVVGFGFTQLKTMFEALQADQAGRDPETRDAELLATFATMNPGFPDEYRAYLAAERERIEELAVNNNLIGDSSRAAWYSGPKTSKGIWPTYRAKLESRLPSDAIGGVDDSTSQILSQSANPLKRGDKRKGLVVGYVQSGKTANYAGLVAKAVDAGYRIVIVLAGMHSNLRAQTQARLDGDLRLRELKDGGVAWYPLTDVNSDIAPINPVSPVGNQANAIVMVVKKNEKRLANVLNYLQSISKSDPQILLSRAVLIIDDESDQATPNTKGAKNLVSTINQRIRDIWAEVKTGTYVAYTATPFANIFTDPNDENDLYPDDFAVVLPRPIGYMGADTYFDTSSLDDEEGIASDALARTISDDEAAVLAPSGRDLSDYDPQITSALAEAIRWFLLATAIRRLRTGKEEHSSMLLHTSHRVEAHARLRDAVVDFLKDVALEGDRRHDSFESTFHAEIDRAAELRGEESVPSWSDVWSVVEDLISNVQVRVDNGTSDNRVSYPDDEPQTVIAIGGGTLSRGLTLEGLVVSFFLRTSNAYDTLLQMGRWFGFRPRYRDLARVWAASGMLDDYAHLALVERELREDIAVMISEGMTPRDIAVPVRAHKGRLQITGAGKMDFVDLVHTGLGGNRRQTIYLDSSTEGIERTQGAARRIVENAIGTRASIDSLGGAAGQPAAHLFEGLSHANLIEFLERYGVFPVDVALQPVAIRRWTGEHGDGKSWDLLLISGPASNNATFEYAEGVRVNVVSRAPLKDWDQSRFEDAIRAGASVVNIRALMSSADSTADLAILDRNGLLDDATRAAYKELKKSDVQAVKSFRRGSRPDNGLVILYAIGKDSEPATVSTTTRRSMEAPDHPIGIAVVFPPAEFERDGDHYAVTLKSIFDPGDEEIEDGESEIVDDEADFAAQDTGL
ncbi:Z1 domain-containing protein [Microbacterium luteolum]|uniref:Z1 domain-containing protein n=1 Tax=Microbacterium luteolum TaxID=69367 RepID=A0ABY7XS35_MICLT|nr:Z1 domain-containing protein [Microbacterium luteolum]WDM44924.1 Z1 domain-containing protein [Microbacterium luteolum]